MVKVDSKTEYSINFKIYDVNKINLVDPSSVQLADDPSTYLTLTDTATRQMASIYELCSKKFSKDLYYIDQDLWKQLINKKRLSNNVINNIQNSIALSIDDSIINIESGKTHLPKAIDIINQYITSDDLTVYLRVDPDNNVITILAIDEDNVGILLNYYIESNWMVIRDCYYNRESTLLLLAPTPELDASVNDETSEIASKDLCYNSSKLAMPDLLESMIEKLNSTFLSEEEILNIFKKSLNIKLKYDALDTIDLSADRGYTVKVKEALDTVINKIYNDESFLSRINSHWIKRSIYITSVSFFDIVKIYSALLMKDKLDSDVLYRLINDCMTGCNNYTYLNS